MSSCCLPVRPRGESAATASLLAPPLSPSLLLYHPHRGARSALKRGKSCNHCNRPIMRSSSSAAVSLLRAGIVSGAWSGARPALPAARRSLAAVLSPARAAGRLQPMPMPAWAASRPAGRCCPADGRRRLSDDADKDVREAKAFLARLRYSPEVADGIIAALKSSGALLPTLYAMAGNWVRGPLTRHPRRCRRAGTPLCYHTACLCSDAC